MALFTDFKTFAFKGNMIDLAVGVIIAAAFGKIVTALVADIFMPIVSLAMPGGDWRANGIVLRHGATAAEDVVLKYGDLLGAIVDFVLVAFILFMIVSKIMRSAEQRGPEAPSSKECPFCCETVPIKATRCKACTSMFAAAASPAP